MSIFVIMGFGAFIGLFCACAVSNAIDEQERKNEERKHKH